MPLAAIRALLVLFLFASSAWAGNVALVLGESGGPYAEFSAALREAIDDSSWKISSLGGVDSLDAPADKPDLIVAVGSNALRHMLARAGPQPIIATLIPRLTYEKLLADSGSRNRRVTAIWLDQPAARQAAFVRHVLPGRNRVGMLLSNETRSQAAHFRQAFSAAGLILDSEDSDADATLLPALNTLLARVHVLLATPDSSIYKRDNIKSILITTYRHQRPVIAFSPALVNAGALAAIYSTPAQIARQTAEMLHAYGSALPSPMFPNQFAILINQNVAQAFDLHIPDEADIRRALLADKETR
ncbi:MAG: ABC transporter substrate-binding protein [Bacteroidota bacterium]